MYKHLFYILVILLLVVSCCDERSTSDSPYNVYFTDRTIIQKIKVKEINKTFVVNNSVAYLFLNPQGNISTFTIYTASDSGTFSISYTRQFTYESDKCNSTLRIVYDAKIASSTFNNVQINPYYNEKPIIEITR